MNRAAAMTAASALCLLWTAGCASTGESSSPAATSAAAKAAGVGANSYGREIASAELRPRRGDAVAANYAGALPGAACL